MSGQLKPSVCIDAVLGEHSIADAVSLVKKCGIDAFEFWGWWDKPLEELQSACQQHDMRISACCTKFISLVDPATRSDYLAGLEASISAAQQLGTSTLISQVGDFRSGVTRAEQHACLVDGLREAAPMLEAAGMTLVIEPLNELVDHAGYYLIRSDEAFEIIEEVNSSHIKVVFDIYHQQISEGHLINMGWAAALGFALYLFFKYTKQGIAMRAVTDDPETAQLMGIPVRFIVLLTWGMAGLLAAFAGILIAPIIYVAPEMMDEVLIKGYVAAVFGGLYSIPGAIVGALLIGVAENLAGGYLGSHYKTATAFVMIVVLLAFRPQGLFGIQKRREF